MHYFRYDISFFSNVFSASTCRAVEFSVHHQAATIEVQSHSDPSASDFYQGDGIAMEWEIYISPVKWYQVVYCIYI